MRLIGSDIHPNIHINLSNKSKISVDKKITITLITKNIGDNTHTHINSIISWINNTPGLIIHSIHKLHVKVIASIKSLSKIFKTKFHLYTYTCPKTGKITNNIHANKSAIKLPKILRGIVTCVLGLDSIPIFTSMHKLGVLPDRSTKIDINNSSAYFDPRSLSGIYNFPKSTANAFPTSGSGQKIGIVELGGAFFQSDLNSYFTSMSAFFPTMGYTTAPTVSVVLVDGATQSDGTDSNSLEVALDIDVIAAICPAANTTIYFANNSMQSFYDVIYVSGGNSDVVSISWGLPESGINPNVAEAFADICTTFPNTTICVASGDTFGEISFPGTVPTCLSVGGTTLTANAAPSVLYISETPWAGSNNSGTGGGFSSIYPQPAYQSHISGQSFRGVPDVSADADPNTGYVIYDSIWGGNLVIGGTSASTPLWASLIAQLNIAHGKNLGTNCNALLYSMATSNQSTSFRYIPWSGFTSTYWNDRTGLGSPLGTGIQSLLPNFPNSITITPNTSGYKFPTNVIVSGNDLAGLYALSNIMIGNSTVVNIAFSCTVPNISSSSYPVNTPFVMNTPYGSISVPGGYTYTDYIPSILNISTSNGSVSGGGNILLTGSNLGYVSNVLFGNSNSTIISKSDSTLSCTIPSSLTAGNVSIIVINSAGNTSLSNAYTYYSPQTISNVSPALVSNGGGSIITITGTNLNTVTSATVAGNIAVTLTGNSSLSRTFTAPATRTTGNGNLILANPYGYTILSPFNYALSTSMISFTPTSGSRASNVPITFSSTPAGGYNFTLVSKVTIGTRSFTSFTTKTATSLVFTIPSLTSITTGNVSVAFTATSGNITLPTTYKITV